MEKLLENKGLHKNSTKNCIELKEILSQKIKKANLVSFQQGRAEILVKMLNSKIEGKIWKSSQTSKAQVNTKNKETKN